MDYLKVWTDFRQIMEPLTDAEKGRLFEIMLIYAETGEEPQDFQGNERFVWPSAKRDIDNARKKSETNSKNGLKGGRPETEEKRTEANETEEKRTEANESLKEKKGNIKENFIDDDNARAIQDEQNRVLDAAEDAGFLKSNSVRAKLLQLFAVHGLDKMLSALDSCVKHSAPNIAYLEAVLKGEPKKPKPEKPRVIAQAYEQRDYSCVQDELMAQQDREMEAFMEQEKGAS